MSYILPSALPSGWTSSSNVLNGGGGELINVIPHFRRVERMVFPVSGSGTSLVTNGPYLTAGTAAGVAATTTEPAYVSFQTASGTGNQAYIYDSVLTYPVGNNLYWKGLFKIDTLTSIRLWLGMYSGGVLSGYNADDLSAKKIAMFRYSTVAGDVNFQAVLSNGVAQTVTDTGVAADTNVHWFEIWEDTSNNVWHFYIDGNEVAAGMSQTNRPTAIVQGGLAVITTQSAAQPKLFLAYESVQSDK